MTQGQTIGDDAARIGPPSETAREYLPEGVTPVADMRSVAPTVAALLGVSAPANAGEPVLEDVVATLSETERLAHIVVDAFGVATWKCHSSVSHVFNRAAAVRQVELQSVLPAVTAVNFATIASGASPEQHGIQDRTDELTVDTIFARLAEAGKVSSVCGRALSTAGILLSSHSSNPMVAESNTDKEVLDHFCAQLEEETDYVLAQLLDVDNAGHADGPWGLKSRQAAGRTDFRLRTMLQVASEHGYAILLHADHGQHDVEPEDEHPNPDEQGTHNGRHEEDVRVPFIYLRHDELEQVLTKQ